MLEVIQYRDSKLMLPEIPFESVELPNKRGANDRYPYG